MELLETDRTFEAELDGELGLVTDAVLLVASGGARRVVVANIRHGRVIAAPARTIAREAGVSLATLPTADRARVDLVIEQLAPERATDLRA